MEKEITNNSSKLNESLTLTNRSILKLEGISEIVSSSDSSINIKLKDTSLSISGQNINITKLDVNSGVLEASGSFLEIKYGKNISLFKRIFK